MRFLDDFYIFCNVVEHGSMKKASEVLEVPLSTVSRRMNALEEQIGIKLLIRSKTSLTPSNEGKHYYDRLAPHYHRLAEEIDNIRLDEEDVSGKVSIDCTPFVYRCFLKTNLTNLVKQYPRLKLKLIPATDTSVIAPDADIAILAGDLQDSNLIARKLDDTNIKVVVSKKYADENGVVKDMNQLKQYPFIGHLQTQQFTGYNVDTEKVDSILLSPKVTMSDAQSMIDMVVNDVGFCFTPEYFVEDQLKTGELVEWLPNYDFAKRPLSVVYRHRTLKSNAQQIVLDTIIDAFRDANI
ncbi:LysR family transcriptional regulator [Vibrio sp. FNV 38]|nr:LysR family transcriptional regulator [Vibrio sp. FNV 38]